MRVALMYACSERERERLFALVIICMYMRVVERAQIYVGVDVCVWM